MADLSINTANVKRTGGVPSKVVIGGEAITRGQLVYRDTSDNEHKLADCDTDATSEVNGLSLTDGNDGGQMIIGVKGTEVNIGATTVAGKAYWLTGTPGGIGAEGEATPTTGDYRVLAFYGSGTSTVVLELEKAAAVIP